MQRTPFKHHRFPPQIILCAVRWYCRYALMGGIFSFAFDRGLIEVNPVRGIKRFADKKGDRYLSQQELVAFGQAMRDAISNGLNPQAVDILKLLIFTGARKSEIESLKWSEVDFEAAYCRLGDSKTGQKLLRLNAGALEVQSSISPMQGSPYVFPAHRGASYYQGTPKVWHAVRVLAGFEDVRLHDLRRSFASIADSGGASLPMIGALPDHTDCATTQRYAHLHDDPLKAASETTENKFAAAFSPDNSTGANARAAKVTQLSQRVK